MVFRGLVGALQVQAPVAGPRSAAFLQRLKAEGATFVARIVCGKMDGEAHDLVFCRNTGK